MARVWIPGTGGSSESAACEGLDDWPKKSKQREERLSELFQPAIEDRIQSRTEYVAISDEVQVIALEQRRSDPPAEAVKLNGLLVDMYRLTARQIRSSINGNLSNVEPYEMQALELAIDADEETTRVLKGVPIAPAERRSRQVTEGTSLEFVIRHGSLEYCDRLTFLIISNPEGPFQNHQ